MSELEKILGLNFPKDTKISFATNSSDKIKKNSIFFGLPGTKNHGSRYCEKAIDLGASLACLLYTSPSPRDLSTSRMPSSA